MKKRYQEPIAITVDLNGTDILTSSVGGASVGGANGDRYAYDCFEELA